MNKVLLTQYRYVVGMKYLEVHVSSKNYFVHSFLVKIVDRTDRLLRLTGRAGQNWYRRRAK